MRIDAPIITGSFSLNGSTLGSLASVATTGSNTFLGGQSATSFAGDQLTANDRAYLRRIDGIAGTTIEVIAPISASAGITGSTNFDTIVNKPTLVSGSSQVIDILSSLNTTTASFTPRITNLESKSSSVDISITNINSYTSSQDTKNTTLGSYTGSNDTKWMSIGNVTGSYATTGSNTFFGTQTYSGSVYIANDLIVQGSSSIQYISASSVSIGTNIVQLNTATPSVRYAGLSVQDSGSSAGVTGSMLWDSLCNRWIYSNPSGVGYSGGMLLSGPRTQTLGTEPTLTCNYIAKSGGGDHLYDSCIIDDGTTVCVKNNLVGTGTITGTTIYGSTAVCSPVGKFTSCIDAGSATFSNSLTVDYAAVDVDLNVKNTQSAGAANLYLRANANGTADLRFTRNSDSSIQGRISYSFTDGSMNFRTGGNDNKLLISSTGAATFGNSLGVSGATSTNGVLEVLKASSSIAQFSLGWNASNHTDMYVDATGNFYIQPQGTTRLTISSTGAATFACGVAAASIQLSQDSNSELQLLTINNQNCKGTSSVTRMDIGNWVAQYALTIGRNGICTTGTRFGDNQANTTFIFDNAVSSCGMYIGNASSGGNLHLITGGYKRLSIDSNGVSTFACQFCSKRFIGSSTIGFGGLITGTQSTACQSIESLWALASNRSTATKGSQYGNGTWYIQGYTNAGNWIYYKFMIHDPVWFRAYVYLANYADTSLRKGCLQYSLDNSANWIDLANATNWLYSGTLDGSIALSGDSRYITLRWDSGGGASSLVGWNSVEFTACGSAFYSVNGLG